ncbi:hypothetical protein L6452_18089 [Arctium lappa]|uniref:Uncharacterized protein n=1 Tax=Arctium lappa TaxID=4217 RepID=A0ACB9C594_ARCLA|nr:hypothetical protein L6452_18089 [Arctium lappa]
MQKGDDHEQQHSHTSEETSECSPTNLWFNGAPYTSINTSNDGPNYTDIVKVLSQVELPSPSPVLGTSCTLTMEGQPSGTKKVDEIEGNGEPEGEQLKDEHEISQEPGTQPHPQRDQASILDDAIKHIKYLQMQVQLNHQMMQCMGAGAMSQGVYMPPFQGPSLPAYFTMRPMIGVDYNMGQYGSYFTSGFPIFPPFQTGFNPLVPLVEVDEGSRRLLPMQFPSQTYEMYSTTLSLNTIIDPTIGSQVGSEISSQSSHHMPVTSQPVDDLHATKVAPKAPDLFPVSIILFVWLNLAHSSPNRRLITCPKKALEDGISHRMISRMGTWS